LYDAAYALSFLKLGALCGALQLIERVHSIVLLG